MKILLYSADNRRSKWLELALENQGFDVVCSLPEENFPNADLAWNLYNQNKILTRVLPDIVIFTPSIANFALDCPKQMLLVLDVANTNSLTSLVIKDGNLPNLIVSALSRADRLIVESQQSQLYWYGWMIQAAKVPSEGHSIDIITEDSLNSSDLLGFLRQPRKLHNLKPVKGYVYTRPSFLAPIGTAQDLPLSASMGYVRQDFTVPIDDLYSIEIPLRLLSADMKSQIKHIEIDILSENGRKLISRSILSEDIPETGAVFINFSKLRPPTGGKKLSLRLKLFENDNKLSDFPICLKCYKETNYPLSELSTDINNSEGSLALSFHPNSTKVFLVTRAFKMLFQGEWKRFFRAIKRRFAIA